MKKHVAIIIACVLTILLACCVVLNVCNWVDDEFISILLSMINDNPKSYAWLCDNCKTGDIIFKINTSNYPLAVFSGHSVTHVALVVKMNPKHQYHESLLVYECTMGLGSQRDSRFKTLNSFLKTHNPKHNVFGLLPINKAISTTKIIQASRKERPLSYNGEVIALQVNSFIRRYNLYFLPTFPLSSETHKTGLCSDSVCRILVACGVLDPKVLTQFKGNIDARSPLYIRPLEFLLDPQESKLKVPIKRALMNGYSFLPPVAVSIADG